MGHNFSNWDQLHRNTNRDTIPEKDTIFCFGTQTSPNFSRNREIFNIPLKNASTSSRLAVEVNNHHQKCILRQEIQFQMYTESGHNFVPGTHKDQGLTLLGHNFANRDRLDRDAIGTQSLKGTQFSRLGRVFGRLGHNLGRFSWP